MNDERITDTVEYGRHITLTCANHPNLAWSTKNIGTTYDGVIYRARSLFYITRNIPECDCPVSLLKFVE